MPKLIDITPEQRFIGLFIGESGTGKTCAECSFPKPLHVMDFDGRIRGAMGHKWLPMEGITYNYYPPREQNLAGNVDKYLEGLLTASSVGQPIPKTLILDSVTSECFAMIIQALSLTHNKDNRGTDQRAGKFLGTIPMPGPEDYGFEATFTYGMFSFFRSIPIQNIIVSAHVIPTYGKEDPDNPYSNNVVTGEKLSVRDKIGANIGIYFDHIFRFRKTFSANAEKFTVQFRSDIARTAYSGLPNGELDITGKNFYNEILGQYVKETQNVPSNSI